ncbi:MULTISPECIES: NAD-dependent succinate-semialdehyde dehydrogenase [Rhizobium]|uniref:Succinate-semialdehyde dehydrogenase (NADP(+)) 2 n=4 Tax=Rhizobium TaxID=379 RepID=A0A1L5PBC5_RHIET|nr:MULTISPECIES: NAD-dependent succinate-semialdehyde dehydrogenase [Rhizobium]EGE61601.1 succinate-semialdehyde dehdyrogenase [Rhizobium etli CNPAF512]APO77414.1 succinate-semialdehyde dehydrogenase (NADP(+)) 2 [Rhizobium etli 8C-3]MBB4332857.1 succinate-semialdehyde dehydrogenase/glutarate-semialdehyde dehydrogenase [Rhizobium leguminosarum]MBB4358450.1 succinate-semialdehyde dehydrogenase/glutarate-semialdehyde dehydrogenase [Rhizobium leguminosarum]MBB4510996.1 succinate-semialdehyde dehyd
MAISSTLLGRLKDQTLVREQMLVGGKWSSEGVNGTRINVLNPSTMDVLASLPSAGLAEVRASIDAAKAAQKKWARVSAKERSLIMRKFYEEVVANAEDLAVILTSEMGKPLAEARGEIAYGASYIEWFGEEAKRVYGDTIPGHQADKRLLVIKQPVGVVAAIAPWNFPSAMVCRKIAPALASGCAIVFKPAAETPLSALALAILAERAGIPDGLFSVLPTDNARMFGEEVCSNPVVKKLTFTGSTEVGRILMAQGAQKIMKLSLELGGNAPFIVFDDADLDQAVEGAMLSKFRNAGQTCVCANRIYVQSGIHDRFVEKLAMRVSALQVLDGFESGATIGPLINDEAVAKLYGHIDDAVTKGATVVVGGDRDARGGTFVQPTLLSGATKDMKVAREETFAPLAPVFKFDTVEEVIELANDTEFGLAAYFFANDLRNVWKVTEALEYGMVGVNTGLISTELAPFGGVKQSGFGREGSKYGMDDFLSMKYVCMGGIGA